MITKEGSTNILNCKTPGAGVLVPSFGFIHLNQRVTIHYFFKIFYSTPIHSTPLPGRDQTPLGVGGGGGVKIFRSPESLR